MQLDAPLTSAVRQHRGRPLDDGCEITDLESRALAPCEVEELANDFVCLFCRERVVVTRERAATPEIKAEPTADTNKSVATKFVLATFPVFRKRSCMVTFSPTSTVPLAGDKLSVVSVAPAGMTLTNGAATVMETEAMLFTVLGSL